MHCRVRYLLDFDLRIRSGQVWPWKWAQTPPPKKWILSKKLTVLMILQSKILDYLKYTAKSIQIRFILLLGVSLKMNKPVGSNKQGGTWWNLNFFASSRPGHDIFGEYIGQISGGFIGYSEKSEYYSDFSEYFFQNIFKSFQ